jgi:hypothetical protein
LLKIKNTEGYDRIPQRVLVDGIDVLTFPLSILFVKIFHEKAISGNGSLRKQSLFSKTKKMRKTLRATGQLLTCAQPLKCLES